MEKGFDVVRLHATSIGAFHVYSDTLDFANVHGVVGKHMFVKQVLEMITIKCCVEHSGKERLSLWFLSKSNGLNQQFTQRFPLELKLAEYIEHLPT